MPFLLAKSFAGCIWLLLIYPSSSTLASTERTLTLRPSGGRQVEEPTDREAVGSYFCFGIYRQYKSALHMGPYPRLTLFSWCRGIASDTDTISLG